MGGGIDRLAHSRTRALPRSRTRALPRTVDSERAVDLASLSLGDIGATEGRIHNASVL
jgi:hypothetical protein